MKTPRAPTLRVRTEATPHDCFVAIHHHLGGNVIHNLLLFRSAMVSIEVALGCAGDADSVTGAVADAHLASGNVDDHAAHVTAPRGSGKRMRDLIVGQCGASGE